MRRLFISFSGGETSGYMTLMCWHYWAPYYDEVVVVFANTGQETEQTLIFVKWFEDYYGIPVVWLEGVTEHGKRKGNTHRITDYYNASRDGEPFADMIRKYGIPNKAYPHCTRELKLNPMASYLRSLGWKEYDTAVGIRVDEIDRMSAKAKKNRVFYPLIKHWPMTKPDINAFWATQPYRLDLKGFEGNCKWCWKKTLRKHLTLMRYHPQWYDFPEQMEETMGLAGHNKDGTHRVFFRENMSVKDLRELAQKPFNEVEDDAQVYPDNELEGHTLDVSNGCSESCEVDFVELRSMV